MYIMTLEPRSQCFPRLFTNKFWRGRAAAAEEFDPSAGGATYSEMRMRISSLKLNPQQAGWYWSQQVRNSGRKLVALRAEESYIEMWAEIAVFLKLFLSYQSRNPPTVLDRKLRNLLLPSRILS